MTDPQAPALLAGTTPLGDLELLAGEMYDRWDTDQRAGKILSALAGMMSPGYKPEVDRVRAALAAAPTLAAENAALKAEVERYRDLAAVTHKANMATNDEAAKLHEQIDAAKDEAENAHVDFMSMTMLERKARDALATLRADADALAESLKDNSAGLEYVRYHYGDLYGVGFDRCRDSADLALARYQERKS